MSHHFPPDIDDFMCRYQSIAPVHPTTTAAETCYFDELNPYYPLNVRFDSAKLLSEIQAINHLMVAPTYGLASKEQKGVYSSQGWEVLVLRGLGMHHYNRAQFYGYPSEDAAPYDWTEIASECPEAVRFVESLPYKRIHRIWYAVLRGGGYITPHVGRKIENQHNHKMTFALNHPEGFQFSFEGGAVPWSAGKGFLLKVENYKHGAIHRGQEDRYHLITMGEPDWDKLEHVLVKN